MPTQRKCRLDSSRHSPNPTSTTPPAIETTREVSTDPVSVTTTATTNTDAACPAAIAGSAWSTSARDRSCRPRATANSQPMPGLRPWKAPSATSAISEPSLMEPRGL